MAEYVVFYFCFSLRGIVEGVTCTPCKATFTPLSKEMGVGMAFIHQNLISYCAPPTGLRAPEVSFITQSQSPDSSRFCNKGTEHKKKSQITCLKSQGYKVAVPIASLCSAIMSPVCTARVKTGVVYGHGFVVQTTTVKQPFGCTFPF